MKFFPYTDNCRLNKILKTSEHRSISLIVLLLIFSFLFLLGYLYENGKGVPQDYKEAVKRYRLAAENGDAEAQNNMGVMYEKGRAVPQNDKEALKWFRLAAEQGLAEAQNDLGYMYKEGQGVTQDYKEALKWYRLAAEQGHAEARKKIKRLDLEPKPKAKVFS